MTEHKWRRQDRRLVRNDVLRTKVGNKQHPRYGRWAYAICTGFGFGCEPNTMGNAIFVCFEGFDLQEVMSHLPLPDSALDPGDHRGARWEAFWPVEYLERPVKTDKLTLSPEEYEAVRSLDKVTVIDEVPHILREVPGEGFYLVPIEVQADHKKAG